MPDVMNPLDPLRAQIDALDDDILRLLNQRARLAIEVGKIKNRDGLPIYSPEREEQLLRSLAQKNQGPLDELSIRAIYREIMSAAISLEKNLVVACIGPAFSAGYCAAREKFGACVRIRVLSGAREVVHAVSEGSADYGVMVYFTEAGIEGGSLRALEGSSLQVNALISLSSPDGSGMWRFFVVGKAPARPSGDDRTIILFHLANRPGSLVHAIEPFSEAGINLVHITSLPAPQGQPGELFCVELGAHRDDPALQAAVDSLRTQCTSLSILGSFPAPAATE